MKLPPLFSNPKVGLIFWACVIVIGLAIYVGATWMQQRG
jgi:hypothetical protein